MAPAHLNPALAISSSRVLFCRYGQPVVSAQPGRAVLMQSRSLPFSSGHAAAAGGGLRLAAAVEPRAVQQEEERDGRADGSGEACADETAGASSKLVLVVGGTGSVGQLVAASLLSRKIKARLLLRNREKAVSLFGKQDESLLQVYEADMRNADDLNPEMFETGHFEKAWLLFGVKIMECFDTD